ncbi:MAG TPA: hypothetical protein VKU00_06830 [Chthonomonadaceae bacterium]|nr:hypothetical protein [Chthonomonadaceae bacterium]
MDKRRWIALSIIPLVALTGFGSTTAYNMAVDHSLEVEGLSKDFYSWRPTPADVHQELDSIPSEKARKERFTTLFKQRFRQHNPPMAVGLRFLAGDRIQLMCPARMEPWNMDRLAMETWRETQTDFGHAFDIDIYITFIGSAPLRVGELRPMPNNPSAAQISYHEPEIPGRKAEAEYRPLLLFTHPLRINYRILIQDEN